jgi:hypothetical protein
VSSFSFLFAVLPAGTLLKVAEVGAGRSHEDEIRSKKDAETPAITYVCAAVFVALGCCDRVYPSQGSEAE